MISRSRANLPIWCSTSSTGTCWAPGAQAPAERAQAHEARIGHAYGASERRRHDRQAGVRRVARGKMPLQAGREHFHYVLMRAGLSGRQVLAVLVAFSVLYA